MKIDLNLLPEEKKNNLKRKKVFWLIIRQEVLFLFAVVFLIAFLISTNLILGVQSKGIETLNSLGESGQDFAEIQKYEAKFKETNEKTAVYRKIASNHLHWSHLLEKLSMVTPDSVSISGLVTKNYSISLSGKAKGRDDLLKFRDNIEKDECFGDINVPLSNYVAKENVDFQIDFKIKTDCLK
jgi:Tfp pilus assembly protein PilN